MGARLWLKPDAVGLIVGRGYDFPAPIQEKLDSYGPCWAYQGYPAERSFRVRRSRARCGAGPGWLANALTGRQARTTLSGNGRTFEALGKRIWQTPRDLALVGYSAPMFLHLVCSPQRAADFLRELHDMGNGWDRTKIIFEPMPADCVSQNLEALRAVLPDIEVFSPNEEEAARFLGVQLPESTDERRAAVQDVAGRMRALGAKKHIVIRSGALGACIDSTDGGCCWVPAYHGNTEKIVDFTGAGNAFLVRVQAGMRTQNVGLTAPVVNGRAV